MENVSNWVSQPYVTSHKTGFSVNHFQGTGLTYESSAVLAKRRRLFNTRTTDKWIFVGRRVINSPLLLPVIDYYKIPLYSMLPWFWIIYNTAIKPSAHLVTSLAELVVIRNYNTTHIDVYSIYAINSTYLWIFRLFPWCYHWITRRRTAGTLNSLVIR